jgi:hypothetical protein
MAGFRDNFQDHRRLSEQIFERQAAIGKPEQASRRGFLEGFSQLVSDFIEAGRYLILNVLHKKTAKNRENHHTKSNVSIFRTFKTYPSRDTFPLNKGSPVCQT